MSAAPAPAARPPLRAVLVDAVGTVMRLREPVGETYARLAGGGDPGGAAGRVRPRVAPPPADGVPRSGRRRRRALLSGIGGGTLVATVFAAAGTALPAGAFDRLWEHYAGADAWAAAPGAPRCCAGCASAACAPAWCRTSTTACRRCWRRSACAPLLDVVVLPADAGAAKPDPRIFHAALARLGVAPAAALYVGDDADDDIAGAAAAGLRALDVASVKDLSEILAECGA